MIRRNKAILRLTAAALSLGMIMSIPQSAFANEYRSAEEANLNEDDYLSAKDENGIEWKYIKQSDGTIAIAMGTIDLPETIKVPAELDGHKVSYLISITKDVYRFTDEYSQMRKNAESVKTIIIPEGITRVDSLGFCSNVENISIPSSVNVISKYTFPTKWLDANRDANGLVIKQGHLIDGSKASGDITISSDIKYIATAAFEMNDNITTVNIPSTVKTIGSNGFFRCANLTKVTMNEGLEYIGEKAFAECYKLKEAVVPSTVTEMGDGVFYDDRELETTTPNSDGLVIVDGVLMDGRGAKGDVVIPSGVTKIKAGSFWNNHSIKSLKIPATVTEIEDRAFPGSSLEKVNIPGSVKVIPWVAFEHCLELKEVIIEDGVETIGSSAFSQCSSLTKINIPDSVTKIDSSAFSYCSKLADVKYKDGIEVAENAFKGTPWKDGVQEDNKDDETTGGETTNVGWFKDTDGKWYYIDNNGTKKTGWFKDTNGKWYYFNKDGVRQSGWVKDNDGTWYHLKADGEMTTGWFKDTNGKWYYFNTSGARQSGWFRDNDGTWYHLKADGEMSVGWFQDTNGKWYYFNTNGSRRSGWLKDAGKWYYLKADGEMATGWIQDTDGKWYYLYSNGSMAYNTYIGSYYVGASGAWVR